MLYTYQVTVTRIVDGDTIDCDIDLGFDQWIRNARVRLKGVDTPEVRTRDLVEKEFGFLAQERVEQLMELGSQVLLNSKEYRREGFGRILGDFQLPNGAWLTETLLSERLAVKWTPNDRVGMHLRHRENWQWLMENDRVDAERAQRVRILMEDES